MEFAYRTFYIDESVDKFNDVEETIKNYGIEQYLIAHEQYNRKGQDKPHFHFLVFTTLKNLRALVKYFVEKYNLANTDGKRGGLSQVWNPLRWETNTRRNEVRNVSM